MQIKQIVKIYSQKLKTKSSSPILDIELLLLKTLNKNKEYLYTYPEKKLTKSQLAKFKILFNRRSKGEPIAYILGHQEFYKLNFKVNKSVLIPRPETEILVEEVINYYKSQKTKNKSQIIVDIGVGSGAIIIALAKNLQGQFFGSEISSKALTVAKQNTKTHKIFCHTNPSRSINKKPCIKFLKGNLLEPLIKIQNSEFRIQNSIITANLPYLTTRQLNNQQLKFEPRQALNGGPDGLKYFREFFEQIKEYKLKPKAILLEIGHNQATQIKKIAKQVLPKYKFKVKKDLCGFDRVIILTKK